MRGKCKFYMALDSYKINHVEKMFWGNTEAYVLQKKKKDFWSISMKFLLLGEGSSSAMPYDLTIYYKHSQTKKYMKNINMKTDITLSSCRCV